MNVARQIDLVLPVLRPLQLDLRRVKRQVKMLLHKSLLYDKGTGFVQAYALTSSLTLASSFTAAKPAAPDPLSKPPHISSRGKKGTGEEEVTGIQKPLESSR